jgi:hypothetical protein
LSSPRRQIPFGGSERKKAEGARKGKKSRQFTQKFLSKNVILNSLKWCCVRNLMIYTFVKLERNNFYIFQFRGTVKKKGWEPLV